MPSRAPGPDAAPSWLEELSIAAGPPWHAMGTRALDRQAPLTTVRPDRFARKAALLRTVRDEVVGMVDGAGPAVRAVAELAAGAVGAELDRSRPPLEAAALVVDEDLCVLGRHGSQWRLDAGVVCFPSMWGIRQKLGLAVTDVHGPVPAYEAELADRVDRFLDRFLDRSSPPRPVWRRNWFVHATDELHLLAPPAASGSALSHAIHPEQLWLRSERQTLIRVPATDAILFAIRTDQVPVRVLRQRPDLAARMAAAIAAWSPELVEYRQAAGWRDPLVAWLSSVSRHR